MTEIPAIAQGVAIRDSAHRIVFGAPVIEAEEIAAVVACLKSRWIGAGGRVERFQQEFADYKGAEHAVAVSSGSAALHLSLLALGIGAGDEVIAPTMTFCSTVHSILHTGAKPVLADCLPGTGNIDPEAVERAITPRTRALIAVHLHGRCCDMDPLVALARKHNLKLIEDCAHSIESSYRGTPAGLFGDTGCFSFYATKNISTGDGGMVVTRNPRVARRVRRLSLHGMTADAWTRSAGRGREGYQVVAPGFKYNMTDIAAALGSAQLAKVETHWTRREQLWNYYNALLAEAGVALPPAPGNHERHAYHLYAIGLPLEDLTVSRAQIMAAMRAENIGVGVHYLPVHMQPYYRRAFGYRPEDFPVAAHTGTRTLSLPLAAGMTYEDVSDACTALKRVLRYFRLPRSHAGAPQNETASSTAMERQTA